MEDKTNGNNIILSKNLSDTEDLSEYTDADESFSSAPTEFLAEFLSAVMMKDYQKALKYCELILQYEPNNSTAKEFYPLIKQKIEISNNNKWNDEMDDEDSSESINPSSASSEEDLSIGGDDEDESFSGGGTSNLFKKLNHKVGNSSGHSDGTTASYSSLEDDEQQGMIGPSSNFEEDKLLNFTFKNKMTIADLKNGNSSFESTQTKGTNDNEMHLKKSPDFCLVNISSDESESPTEPISQKLIAQLRAKIINSNKI